MIRTAWDPPPVAMATACSSSRTPGLELTYRPVGPLIYFLVNRGAIFNWIFVEKKMGFECCKSHRGDELNPRQMRRLWRNLLTFDDIFGHPQVSSWLAASCRLTRRLPSSTCAADCEVTYHMTRLPNAQVPWEPKQQKQHVRLLSSGQSWLFQTGFFRWTKFSCFILRFPPTAPLTGNRWPLIKASAN